jgi:hypothetical protein
LTASNRSRIHKKRDQLPATGGGSSTAANGRIESPQAVFGASSPTEGITELAAAATPPPPRRDGPIVQLNVGGKCFDTTMETLTVRDPGMSDSSCFVLLRNSATLRCYLQLLIGSL